MLQLIPLTVKITKTFIQNLGWEIIPHPPYSSDLISIDFNHFFALYLNFFEKSNLITTLLFKIGHLELQTTEVFYVQNQKTSRTLRVNHKQ